MFTAKQGQGKKYVLLSPGRMQSLISGTEGDGPLMRPRERVFGKSRVYRGGGFSKSSRGLGLVGFETDCPLPKGGSAIFQSSSWV